ncbi:VOC family protein (plasmid) [Hymenobacter sp. NBH84]|uniref:VOC family protein n=1 Tax=Hymenobacter sp. NBH84 TaxID=2596915 RepID=UPI0016272781|nr:VOC family protein [Hymenobacter sp. NBH84]QNE41973.1 VOC family protein [Hymenobacter sp. NBH84]
MENTTLPLPAKNAEGINGTMRADHVGLRTLDFAGTIGWYTKKLGFRLIKQVTLGDLQLAFLAPANDDNFWLEVLSNGPATPPPSTPPPITSGFQHLCLTVGNVDDTLAALRERGVQVTREPFDVPLLGKRCGFVSDLHGNTLEFIQNIG